MTPLSRAIDRAYEIGMFQHRTEIESFAQWLLQREPANILEIGTLLGGVTSVLCTIASAYVVSVDVPNGRHGGKDHGLDHGRILERNARLTSEFPNLRCVIGDSQLQSTWVAVCDCASEFDCVFIDANHTYENVSRDYELYGKDAPVVAFHDINDSDYMRAQEAGVARFWAEQTRPKLEFNVHHEWGGIGVLL